MKKQLGQFFTDNEEVLEFMVNLIKNENKDIKILEPSAGDGAFVKKLKEKGFDDIVAIEIDKKYCKKNNFICDDFFNFSIENQFDVVIGNPPYVKYDKIKNDTKKYIDENKEIEFKKIFDNRTNLYQYFILKAIYHLKMNGELIFIVPREFLKATSSKIMNKMLYNLGSITDFVDLGDKKIFKDAIPNVVIFKFEKGNYSRKTKVYSELNQNKFEEKYFIESDGQLFFLKEKQYIKFNEYFYVKVGAVSGADKIFEHEDGSDFVCSYTAKTGKTKKMIYNKYHPYLENYKKDLLNRKIKKFDEKNWWEWGRKYYESNSPRIYVNCKTRNEKPFFIHECKAYDGSILAIFPKFEVTEEKLKKICDYLNQIDWEELGFKIDGRYIFSQRSLENALIPIDIENIVKG